MDSLKEGLRLAFDAIDDAFFDLANNARNNNEQNRYFEAMRELRLRRKSIEQNTLDELIKAVRTLKPLPTSTRFKGQSDTLALVDQSALEENLALETMCNKAQQSAQHVMLTLSPRLEEVLGSPLRAEQNPLSPNTLASIISDCCQSLDIQLAERLLVYKYIDKHVFSDLTNALSAVNDALQQQNVLPDLNHKELRASKSATSNTKAPKQKSRASEAVDKDQSAPSQSSHTTGWPQASRNEVLGALDSIANHLRQLEAANQMRPTSSQELLNSITATLAKSKSKAVSEEDLDIINLVAMLFEFILDDPNLAPQMQALIGRLQIPVLKAVLQDPLFFNDHQHPARTFLDRLAKAAIGWTASGESTQQPLYQAIKQIVGSVSGSNSHNSELFAKADDDLRFFCEREEKKRILLEQRTKLTEEGRIKSKVAQEYVDSTLHNLTEGHSLPSSIKELLDGPWRRVMFLAFLRDANEHNWESTRRIAEELVWCSEHHHTDTDRQKWVSIVPKLLKQIAAGLEKISYEQSRSSILLERIRKSLATLFRESSLSNQAPRVPSFKKARSANANAAAESRTNQHPFSPMLSGRIDAQLTSLASGSWIEFDDPLEGKKRYKLVSHIPEAETYIFVDRLGLHALKLSRNELNNALTQKRISLLEKGALVDRALSHVMANMKRH